MKGFWKSGSMANKMHEIKIPTFLLFGITFVGKVKKYCTYSTQLHVYGSIILIYPVLLQLEKILEK